MSIQTHLAELFELLSIPSISAQKAHAADMKRAAQWLVNRLKRLPFDARVYETAGHPIVYAEKLEAGSKPTILVYGHYDVQDPGERALWKSDPFTPEVRGGNLYARGAADDKGQLFTWIAAAAEIVSKNTMLPVNIKFIIEGEEEVGSKNFEQFVRAHKKLLSSHVCVVSDTHCASKDQPVIVVGLRGIAYFEITVRTLSHDVHSGIYGGNVLNPANVLSNIINRLKDTNHTILIPGFFDSVVELTVRELRQLRRFPFTRKEIQRETGAAVVVGEEGYSVPERAGVRPTLDVHGLSAGYQGEGSKTIIPSTASAKISMRLVPNQHPADIEKKFRRYVSRLAPKGATVTVTTHALSEPTIMEMKSPFRRRAEESLASVFGRRPLQSYEGGSIPAVGVIKKYLGIDCLLMGYGLPDDNLHGPNEKFSLTMFERGIENNLVFLTLLGA